jgi:signal transduction histidine kinase
LLLIPCLLPGIAGRTQSADSLKTRLAALLHARQLHMLKDTDYLRSVDSIAPKLEMEDSLPQWLTTYRDIAFADTRPGRHKALYYTYLALNAANTNKLGSAIYYSEKNNDERINAGMFEKGGLSHGDMFAFYVYLNEHDYARIIRKYGPLRPVLLGLPAAIAAGKTSAEQAFVGLSILQVAMFTYYKKADTLHMQEAYRTAQAILEKLHRQPKLYNKARPVFDYLEHYTGFKEQVAFRRLEDAGRLLCAAIDDVNTPTFPAHMKADYGAGLYSDAVEFYLDQHNTDSVRHYLQLMHGVGANALQSTTDTIFLATNDAYLLGDEGRFKDAYLQLKKAYLLRDSAYYAVSSDRDNNLYALAEAENAHAVLLQSEKEKRSAEQSNLLLFFLLFILLLGSTAGFLVYRSRQRRRLLNLKLHLARNFHDAIGPMLLYANARVKKELDDHPTPGLSELKGHISQIMDEVRSISHDLKSTEFGTITTFAWEISGILEKVRATTGITSAVKVDNGDRALSHFQLTHLSKVVQELISNSVKHAGCRQISLEMTGVKRTLQLCYSDDGKGMDPEVKGGIGLQNIRERIASLQGEFKLSNAWPKGYTILISIPLL